ncbi:MAG: T9SS type A sorting domain-containing protein [Candidatus Cloacimonetes bacterium]|nr:T9SS type A sorting domain-containing protein [Candidatus Cloacimonadota bacterium]
MRQIFIIASLLLFTLGLTAEIIHVPEDIEHIQSAIQSSSDGDTILVSPGIYVEHLVIMEKELIIGSLFYTTQDTSYISQTIINGDDNNVVSFSFGENLNSVLSGFTITNGDRGITCYEYSPILENLKIMNNSGTSGGIVCSYSSPVIENVKITNNSAYRGGGINCTYNSHPSLSNVTIAYNTATRCGGGIYCDESSSVIFSIENRCNVYLNNVDNRGIGSEIYSLSTFDVILDTFTVINPTDFHVSPYENFTFDILNGIQDQVNSDLYVSPEGDNSNSGLSVDNPLKTIQYACSIIMSDSLNSHTIYLAEGIYSPSTNGEIFPVSLPGYVSLTGENEENVILDADSIASVMRLINVDNIIISNLTITNGNEFNGGGIYCDYASITLLNVTISDNYAIHDCGGICCINSTMILENVTVANNIGGYTGGIGFGNSYPTLENVTIINNLSGTSGGGIYCSDSSPTLENVLIMNNSANLFGGGIYLSWDSSPTLENVIIADNIAEYGAGGGIFCSEESNPSLLNVTIRNNSANYGGGGIFCEFDSVPVFSSENRCDIYLNNVNNRGSGSDIYSTEPINVIVDTFTVMNPTDFHAAPLENFIFNILNGVQDQVNSDLYVSPEGDNGNNGLSAEEPLKTIQYACSVIQADSLNFHTIYLSEGIYSPSANGEFFPVNLPDNVSLTGENEENVILDGEGITSVMMFYYVENVTVSNLTITNGYAEYGGGVHCSYSSPTLENVIITDNTASNYGGGFFSSIFSDPQLKNVSIVNNTASMGGGFCSFSYVSSPILENVQISNNSAYFGGGFYCYASTSVLKNVTIANNLANSSGGGIYCHHNSSLSLINVNIVNNLASDIGGGIYQSNSNSSIVNCIMWNDTPGEIYFFEDSESDTMTIAYSDIQNGIENIGINNATVNWLEGNIDADPLFADAINGDFALTEDSPCIDAGTAFFEYEGEVLIDIEEEEYWGIAPDMGAYEYGSVRADECKIENVKCKISNYPNPFNPETTISFFTTEGTENTELAIYNLKGQCVREWKIDPSSLHYAATSNGKLKINKVVWDGRNSDGKAVSSGLYLLRLKTEDEQITRKMMLIK